MKKNILLYMSLALCLFAACKKDDPEPPGGNNPVHFLIRETDDTGYYADYTYDSQGRLTQVEGVDFLVTFVYEPSKVISDLTYDNGAGLIDTTHRVFALQNGFASEVTRTYSDGTPKRRTVYERDAANRILKETQYDADGFTTGIITNEYDATGNLFKSTRTSKSGNSTITSIVLNEYVGNIAYTLHTGEEFWIPDPPYALTKTTLTDVNGVEDSHTNYSYDKDTEGRIVKRTDKYFSTSSPSQNYTRANEYFYK
ncbi:MAG: hypothetical protein ACKVUS_08180 [Saprospiraceae bacterium]